MAPIYQLRGERNGDALGGSHDREDGGVLEGSSDEMALLEGTYDAATIPAGAEVEYFAKMLDEGFPPRVSAGERRARVFKLVEGYYRYTTERFEVLLERRRRRQDSREPRAWQKGLRDDISNQESNDMDLDEVEDDALTPRQVQELRRLEVETQTWDLLRRVLPLRYPDASKPQLDTAVASAPERGQSWDGFLRSNPLALERKAILSWLQNNAETGPDLQDLVRDLQQNADRGDIVSHGWLHTRSAIKLQKQVSGIPHALGSDTFISSGSKGNPRPTALITQLDPDAVTRQGRKLDTKDEYFERAIWIGCFGLLRRGRGLAEIREWCLERTEVWRAVSMSALPLSRNEGGEETGDHDVPAIILWRRMCYALAQQGGADDFERAVYGILCGDVASVERVSQNWDDLMFANYNALLRTQFDAYLISKSATDDTAFTLQTFPAFNAVQFHGEASESAAKLIKSLETDNRTRGSLSPIKSLQGAVISETFDQFAYNLGILLAKQVATPHDRQLIPDFGLSAEGLDGNRFITLDDYDGLRIVAHVLIIIRTLEATTPLAPSDAVNRTSKQRQVQENIISAYTTFLRRAGLHELIPLYASKLSGSRVYYTLSKNLIHLEDRDSRSTQLNLMGRLGLNVPEFVVFQPQIYLSDLPEADNSFLAKSGLTILAEHSPQSMFGRVITPDFFGEDPDRVDAAHEYTIRSLEWLLLVPGSVMEALEFTKLSYIYFLENGHLNAARALSARVPCAEILKANAGELVKDHSDPSWFREFSMAEPLQNEGPVERSSLVRAARVVWEMECLVRALDAMETLSSFMQLDAESEPGGSKKEFLAEMGKFVKLAKAYVNPLLREWLTDSNADEEEAFANLRRAYLPETVLAYVSILQYAGQRLTRDNLMECMELAAEIAEKQSDVSEVFVAAGRMKELISAFASCSKALAAMSVEKKSQGISNKKMREKGWSRELWSVKS